MQSNNIIYRRYGKEFDYSFKSEENRVVLKRTVKDLKTGELDVWEKEIPCNFSQRRFQNIICGQAKAALSKVTQILSYNQREILDQWLDKTIQKM